jgi:hypothetical protein
MAKTLYELALNAIRMVFNNPGTLPPETRQDLEGLRDEINVMIDSLPKDEATETDAPAADDIPF